MRFDSTTFHQDVTKRMFLVVVIAAVDAHPLDQVPSKSFSGAGLSFKSEVPEVVGDVGVVVSPSVCNISACWLIMVAFWAVS
jgi:hypothetical protein